MNSIIRNWDIVDEAKEFVDEFTDNIENSSDKTSEQIALFTDNFEKIHKYSSGLTNIISQYQDEDNCNEEELDIKSDAIKALKTLKDCLDKHKSVLIADKDAKTKTVALTKENLTEAIKNDSNTKQIAEFSKQLNETKSLQKSVSNRRTVIKNNDPEINYVLICDDEPTFFYADTKQEIIDTINMILSDIKCRDYHLYKVSFKEIPMKLKTTITI